jgi:hypothetical protein
MLAESALRSALDKVTPIKLAGKFWRVVATSSLLGLVRGENGLPEVTRIHPNLLFAGGPRRVGGRYTPMEGPDTLYLASSERAANAEWKAGLQALFPGVELPPKTVFATEVNLTHQLLSSRQLSSDDYSSWELLTRNYLEKAFGRHSPNISSVMDVGKYGTFPMGPNAQWWENHRIQSLTTQKRKLQGLIELLQTEAQLIGGTPPAPVAPQRGHTIFALSLFSVA